MRGLGPLIVLGLVLAAWAPFARAASTGRIEVVDVAGIVDANVERAVNRNITDANREQALLVVLELNSNGTVGADRASRIASKIRHSSVPVAVWIGPTGAHASNGAVAIWSAADVKAMAPGTFVGPVRTLDLRTGTPRAQIRATLGSADLVRVDADHAKQSGRADVIAGSVGDLIAGLKGRPVRGKPLEVDPQTDEIKLHKVDLLGRALHAAAQPSIAYLLLLLGLVGVLFEAFHPSTGPAGVTGAVALALAVYGTAALGGSWFGFGLIVAGVVGFAVDLRYQSLGAFTLAGFAALTAGSILLFHGPWLRVPPLLIAAGVAGMTAFLLGAMTRVLRDLRLVASGQLQVRDAHEAVTGIDNGQGDGHES